MPGIIQIAFIILLIFAGVVSYGFTDPNLTLSTNHTFLNLQAPLNNLVYRQRPDATIIFLIILALLFAGFLYFLKNPPKIWVIGAATLILVFAYPALTYDLFNYIATAKVTYTHHENPYVVMPIEIPNEPNLAFTRAANKLALYGPAWIVITAIPHYMGGDKIWQTIIAFKLLNAIVYLGFCYFIWRLTNNLMNVVFFALNPLVLIEVLMNGHNDVYMIVLALGGLYLWRKGSKISGGILFVASWFIKEATVVLTPILFLRKLSWEQLLLAAYWLMAFVFFVFAPIREELYPWYAVWLIAPAALLPLKSHKFMYGFTIALSFALELRAIPYMWMGYYEGPGPLLRLLFTAVPVTIYVVYFVIKHPLKPKT